MTQLTNNSLSTATALQAIPAPGYDSAIPVISGNWQATFSPTQPAPGGYMNDHTFIKAPDGKWHLIGISGGGNGNEKSFAHAVSDSLNGPWTQLPPLAAYKDSQGRQLEAWAPHAIHVNGTTYLFYRNNLNGQNTLALDVSTDPNLLIWERRLDVSLTVPSSSVDFRDVMVVDEGNSNYRMYYCGSWAGRSAVGMATSNDLISWTHQGEALTTSGSATEVSWGSVESPFVFKQGEFWYLSITLTTSSQSNYHQTLIFRSADLAWFGDFNGDKTTTSGANLVTELAVHAPEYINDNGQWYISTCGWKGMSIYPEAKTGAAIAPLSFNWIGKGLSENGLVAYYRFEQSKGPTVKDSTGKNNALISGLAGFVGQCENRQALTISGSRPSSLQLPALSFPSDFTFAAWVIPNGFINNTQGLFKLGSNSDINFYQGYPRLHANGSDIAVSSKAISTSKWSHIAITRQAGVIKIYIDAELAATSSTLYSTTVIPERLGQTIAGQGNASYNNLALFARALDATEITTLKEAK